MSAQLAGAYGWRWAVHPPGDIFGAAAVWQNPGSGFGRNCTTWAPLAQCNWTTASDGSDLIYRLEGTLTDSNFSLGGFTGSGVSSIKLSATFPGPGVAILQDTGTLKKAKPRKPPAFVRKARINVARGERKIPVKITGAATRKLREKGKVILRVAVTYTPQGGVPATKRTKLTLTAR